MQPCPSFGVQRPGSVVYNILFLAIASLAWFFAFTRYDSVAKGISTSSHLHHVQAEGSGQSLMLAIIIWLVSLI
jgi:hypothetical protein